MEFQLEKWKLYSCLSWLMVSFDNYAAWHGRAVCSIVFSLLEMGFFSEKYSSVPWIQEPKYKMRYQRWINLSDSKCYHKIAFDGGFGWKAWQQRVPKTITPINPKIQYKWKISNRTFCSEVRKSRESYSF